MNNRVDPRPSAWLAVLVLLLASLAAPAGADAQLNVTGQWSTLPYLAPINPIHVALMHNGKVLIVAGSENDATQSVYKYAVWEPGAGTFTQGTTAWDLFCNGMSLLADGRVFLTGGNLSYEQGSSPFTGLKITTIFDPATETFTQVEDMAKGRWYPTNTFLGDKGTLTFSGLDETGAMNKTVEIYDVGGGWSLPYEAPFTPKWYPRLHLLGNGKVIMTGPDPLTKTFNPFDGSWSGTVAITNYQGSRVYGSSVLLPLHPDDGYKHQIVIMGGNTAGATDTVEIIDTSVWPEAWRTLPPMSAARTTMNAVLLPNGKILALGGSQLFNDASTAALNAETFDAASETWTPSGTMAYARMYHSSALLLPDATVWVAGSNPSAGVWTPQMEIYTPPYLFTAAGSPAPRPSITAAPAVVGYGQTFTVTTPNPATIGKVVLMRPGSNTHAFDAEQRLLHTYFSQGTEPQTLTVAAPTNQNAAPPGYYMLFIVDLAGVPSVAKFVRLSANPANQPPVAAITTPSGSITVAAGEPVTFTGTASDPDGTIAAYQWVFPGGTPASSNAETPPAVTFAAPGTYRASFTVLDNLGDNNVSPPVVTITVTGAGTLGASITAPANGATVSGTIDVAMAATNAQGTPTQFLLKLDNATTLSSQSIPSGSTATYAWNTTGVPDGPHTLDLTVTDGAGRTATATITVTVANGGGGGGGSTPTVTITTPQNGNWIGNSVGIAANASSTVPLTEITFWGNGGVVATAPCSATTCTGDVWWVTGALPDAAYQIHAMATDSGGGCTVSAPVTVNKNATAPVIPSGASCGTPPPPALTASITAPANGATVSGAAVTVDMSAGGAQGTPTQFLLKLDNATTLSNQSVPSGSTATYAWNTTGVPDGPHTLDLTVTDGAGRTATATITVTVANGGGGGGGSTPTVTITTPQNGNWIGNSVGIAANASSTVPLTEITFWGNAGIVATASCSGTTCTGDVYWVTGPLPDAAYQIHAVATDSGGGCTVSAPVTVNKNATAPVIASGATCGGVPPLTAAITSPATGSTATGTVTVDMSAGGAQSAPTQFHLKLDNTTTLSNESVPSGSTASYAWNSASAPNGSHTLDLTVTDGIGRTATASITVSVSNPTGGPDTVPPAVAISSPPNGAWTGNSIDIHVNGTDNVGLASIQVYGNGTLIDTVPCTGTTCAGVVWWVTGSLPPGTHTITAVATDTAANQTTSAAVTINK